jgi:hypothetical protein
MMGEQNAQSAHQMAHKSQPTDGIWKRGNAEWFAVAFGYIQGKHEPATGSRNMPFEYFNLLLLLYESSTLHLFLTERLLLSAVNLFIISQLPFFFLLLNLGSRWNSFSHAKSWRVAWGSSRELRTRVKL